MCNKKKVNVLGINYEPLFQLRSLKDKFGEYHLKQSIENIYTEGCEACAMGATYYVQHFYLADAAQITKLKENLAKLNINIYETSQIRFKECEHVYEYKGMFFFNETKEDKED